MARIVLLAIASNGIDNLISRFKWHFLGTIDGVIIIDILLVLFVFVIVDTQGDGTFICVYCVLNLTLSSFIR